MLILASDVRALTLCTGLIMMTPDPVNRKAVETGDLKAMRQALASLVEAADRAGEEAVAAEAGWAFASEEAEETNHQEELVAAAKEQGLGLYPLEGVMACFPTLVRVMPKYRILTLLPIARKDYSSHEFARDSSSERVAGARQPGKTQVGL